MKTKHSLSIVIIALSAAVMASSSLRSGIPREDLKACLGRFLLASRGMSLGDGETAHSKHPFASALNSGHENGDLDCIAVMRELNEAIYAADRNEANNMGDALFLGALTNYHRSVPSGQGHEDLIPLALKPILPGRDQLKRSSLEPLSYPSIGGATAAGQFALAHELNLEDRQMKSKLQGYIFQILSELGGRLLQNTDNANALAQMYALSRVRDMVLQSPEKLQPQQLAFLKHMLGSAPSSRYLFSSLAAVAPQASDINADGNLGDDNRISRLTSTAAAAARASTSSSKAAFLPSITSQQDHTGALEELNRTALEGGSDNLPASATTGVERAADKRAGWLSKRGRGVMSFDSATSSLTDLLMSEQRQRLHKNREMVRAHLLSQG